MTLLIYLLFLCVAVDVLYLFPYRQTTSYLTQGAGVIAIHYLKWLALDIGVVWIFTTAALHWPIWNYYYSSSHGHGPDQKALIELMLPHQDIALFTTSNKTNGGWKWPIFVVLGLASSVIFDLYISGLI